MRKCVSFFTLLIILLLSGLLLAEPSFDDPYQAKTYYRAKKESGTIQRVVIPSAQDYRKPTPTIAEKIAKNGLTRYELPEPRNLPPEAFQGIQQFPPKPISYRPVTSESRLLRPSAPEPPAPETPGSDMSFRASDVLVSIPSDRPQRQPDCETGPDGTIYAVWGEAIGSANAIMFSKSTDGGNTWSTAIVVDNIGTNFMPRVAVSGSGSSARVHIVYNYLEMHIRDIYDTSGVYLGRDTTYEGDVYYCRSVTGGASFSGYQTIANNDIDLIIFRFMYDEGGADINVDRNGNPIVTYYSQADEGHILMLALWIIYIILTGSLPPFWIEYTWYEVDMRASNNAGGSWGSQFEIVNEWFMDNSLTGSDIEGAGASAYLHAVYTATGILSLGSANSWFARVRTPYGSPAIDRSDVFVFDGYPVPAGVRVDSLGNPRVGLTNRNDVWYTRSTNRGNSWPTSAIPVAISTAMEYEPKLELDLAQNTFLAWTDQRRGDYDIFCVWSEDGGITLRSDQHKVNQSPGTADQYWPGVGLNLSATIRRLDIVWWDTRVDANGDIYYNGANWWRTNLDVRLHDSLAHAMAGTLTLTYTSFGVLITRPISTGYHIIYHDPGTTICLSRISSGSTSTERWIYHETTDFCVTPSSPGNTYVLIYYNQLWTRFTTTRGNPPACTVGPIPSIPFTYEYFALTNVASTDVWRWANYRGEWNYTQAIPSDPAAVQRWYCPEPTGRVLSNLVSPTYYYQYKAVFNIPARLNPRTCTHTVPNFTLVQRWMGGVNAGGITPLTAWADCGSVFEYEDPKIISAEQRWDITTGSPGVVLGVGPYTPGAYHQWRPSITLIGPFLPENPTYCETLYVGGVRTAIANLAGVFQPWADCGLPLWMGNYTALGWVARDPRIFDPVTSAFVATIRYGNVVTVRLINDFGYGFLIADGDTVASGTPLGWVPLSTHNICAISPQEFGSIRFVFDRWSDGGAFCHNVVPVGDTTWTAYYNRQYYLDLISDHGTPWGEGWYNAGAVANFGVARTTGEVGGIRYRFVRWEGTGTGSYTGTDTSANVTMNNPITERAYWNTEFRLIVTYTGSGTYVPVQTGSGWYPQATMATIGTDSIMGDDGPGDTLRYIFDRWESTPAGAVFGSTTRANTTIFMDRPYTVTAVYKRQWKFFVESTDSTLGSPIPPIGEHWFTDGDSVRASVTSPSGSMYCLGYLGWGSITDGTLPRVNFVITRPSRIRWLWGAQFVFRVTADPYEWIMGLASPDPPAGTYYYVPGTRDTFSVNRYTSVMGGYRYKCTGYIGTGPAAPGSDTNWVALTITSSGELRWQFIQQCRFVVVSARDWPIPPVGVHWFDYGTVLNPSVTPIDGVWRCIGYSIVVGGFPTTGYGYSFTMTVTTPCSLTWLWANVADVESLRVISAHGPTIPPAGAWNYFLRGTVVPASASLFDLSAESLGVRYRCIGWTGTGPVPPTGDSNRVSITMSSSGTLTWRWQNQYRAHIACEHDNPMYSLDGSTWMPLGTSTDLWFPEGTRLYIRTNSRDTLAGDSIVYCPGWRGWGSCLSGIDTTLTNFNFVLTSPCSVVFKWSSYMVPLYVYSAYGSPIPRDTTWWIPGTRVDAFVTSPDTTGPSGYRHVCTGFTGTGSAPRSGSGSATSFIITDTSSITWHWQQQVRLRIASIPTLYDAPWPTVGNHWYVPGDSAYGYVTSPVWSGTDTMYCVGFWGTGNAPPRSPQTEFGFRINIPSSVTWRWLPRDSVALLQVISAYGSPRPYGLTAWPKGDTVDAWVNPFVIVGSHRINCTGWRGSGSVTPSSGDSNHVVFRIWVDSQLEWRWALVNSFEVRNPGGYGTPVPPVGIYYHPTGSYVSGEMRNHPYWTGTDTMYCVGFNGWGNLPAWDPHTDFGFNITTNSGITWLWSNVAFRLTVYTPYGNPWPRGTTYWVPLTWVRNARVDSAVIVSPGIRARCAGWTGTGSVPPSGTTNLIPDFQMTMNSTITWHWNMQYSFSITNEGPPPYGYDTPMPRPGVYWYDDGALVTAWIRDNPAPPPYDTMFCIGMTGTGSAPPWSPQDSIWFIIRAPSSCHWRWLRADTVCRLDVISAYDSPRPWGTTYWPKFSTVSATVDPFVEVDTFSRYICRGFDIVGAVDSTDTFTFIEFIIDTHTVLTWNWKGQYFLKLQYAGCPIAPTLTGEGWYYEYDTARFECETPVYHAGSYWGFVRWTVAPDTLHGDTLIFRCWKVMINPAIATAHYAPAIFATVKKDPASNNKGWISIDGVVHDSTYIVSTWWGRGSYHDLLVPQIDSTLAGERYTFARWSDGGARGHRVGPIHNDTVFTAFYTGQYMCVIGKNPPHTWGWIYADGDTFRDVASRIFWWSPRTRHTIGVSTPDSCGSVICDTMRYFFDRWSDGGALFHLTDSIMGPTAFIAYYNSRIRLNLRKQPPHPYGYFICGSDTIRGVSQYNFWLNRGESAIIGVSEYDIADHRPPMRDSVWAFTHWSDGGARIHSVGPILVPASFTAFYNADSVILSVTLNRNFWDIDSVRANATRTMEVSELITATNTGNIPVDFGFVISYPGVWTPSHTPGSNRFVLRVHCSDSPTPPPVFSYSRDWVKDILTWATNDPGGIFGPSGNNVLPAPHPLSARSDNLWMQWVSPTSSVFEGYSRQILVLQLWVKYHMP